MYVCTPSQYLILTCFICLFALSSIVGILSGEELVPESKKDYGSGSATFKLYYEGGVPQLGLFVGQANMYPRNDRCLVRFMISSHLLSGSPIASAVLCFEVVSFSGSEAAHEIEIRHLSYDANSFSDTDLVNSDVKVVGTISVKGDEFIDSKYQMVDGAVSSTTVRLPFRCDVTKCVNEDIASGNIYSSFRLRNVTAEVKRRVDVNVTEGVIVREFHLELR